MSLISKILDFLYNSSPTSFKVSARKICELYRVIKLKNTNLSSKEIAFMTLKQRHTFVRGEKFQDSDINRIINSSDNFEDFIFYTVLSELILEFGSEKINQLSNNAKIEMGRMILEEVQKQGLQNEPWF